MEIILPIAQLPSEKVKLYTNLSLKKHSIFRCNVCARIEDIDISREGDFESAKPVMDEHILKRHPEFSFGCNHCDTKFTSLKDFKSHVKELKPKKEKKQKAKVY